MDKINVLVSGGGTGGHIFPAIAIVEALKKQADIDVLFVGANGRMEMEKVPANGYPIEGLPIAGFQRGMSFSNLIKNIQLPLKVLISFFKVMSIINRFKPDIAIGTGGYASAPTLKMAQWMGIPTFIQEQNAQPGWTNQFLGNQVKCAFISYEESNKYFKNCEVVYTGNAIRESFQDEVMTKEQACQVLGLDKNKKTVFITGGSLGARNINEAIASKINDLIQHDVQVLWQTGKTYYNDYIKYESSSCRVYDFISNMNAVYGASDIIVSRAGGTLFELFVIGKPAIVLPSPYVADDHQTPNAEALVKRNAAIMIKDVEAKDRLVPEILSLLEDEKRRQEMGAVMKGLARPYAASEIARKILKYIGK